MTENLDLTRFETSPEEIKPVRFEDYVHPDFLQAFANTSHGFSYREDPRLAQEFLRTGMLRAGYTDMNTKVIYYNPVYRTGFKAPDGRVVVEPWDQAQAEGFFIHEAEHHTGRVLELDRRLTQDLQDIARHDDIIPEEYRGTPEQEARFLRSIDTNLNNAELDLWLESHAVRDVHPKIRDSIKALHAKDGVPGPEFFSKLSLPEQLLQVMVRAPYHETRELTRRIERGGANEGLVRSESVFKGKVDPRVFDAYSRIVGQGALHAIRDASAEGAFASPLDKQRKMDTKFTAHKDYCLPEYLTLVKEEVKKRKEEKQNEKSGEGKQGKPKLGESGQGEGQAVPLTPEEEKELLEELLKELEKTGAERGTRTPSDEDKQAKDDIYGKISKALEEAAERAKNKGKGQGEGEQPTPREPKPESALDRLARMQDDEMRKSKENRERGLAGAMGVRQESIQRWEKIKEKYHQEIQSTANVLAEVFLADRRPWIAYLKREGAYIPGLEFETVAAKISGDPDPATRMRVEQRKKFLETEIEFICDVSGSMSGEKLEKSIDLMVIVTEAFNKVEQRLRSEQLIFPWDDKPFKIGVTKFDTEPTRVTELKEPLNEKKEVKIIDEVGKIGGGTEETGALTKVYKELTVRFDNVIKIIVVLSDGVGNKAGVVPIIQQVEQDNKVWFLAIGLGETEDQANDVVETYVAPLRRPGRSNVVGKAETNPELVLPFVLDFLKQKVQERRSRR